MNETHKAERAAAWKTIRDSAGTADGKAIVAAIEQMTEIINSNMEGWAVALMEKLDELGGSKSI